MTLHVPEHSYVIPTDGYSTVSFSGGRSSAYMLYRVLECNNGLPSNCKVLFANTGKEHNATLDFVNEVSVNWHVPIVWLEYEYDTNAKGGIKDPKHKHKIVNHNSASRDGSPYELLIKGRGGYVPNLMQRFCTMDLKVNTMRRYMSRDCGIKLYNQLIGIRYDEPARWSKAELTTDCDKLYPMVTDLVTKADVLKFWSSQSFDLKTLDLYGNCDLCFLKRRRKLVEAIKREPSRADWWIKQENRVFKKAERYLTKPQNARFRYVEKYEDLKISALNEQTLWDGKLDVPTSEEIDCFCGD